MRKDVNKILEELIVFHGEKEVKILFECKRLVECLLSENEHLLEYLENHHGKTDITRYRIEQMKYALGKIDKRPNPKDYFDLKKLHRF